MPADRVEPDELHAGGPSAPAAGSGGRAGQTITHPSDHPGRGGGGPSGVGPAADAFSGYEIDREIHRGGQGVVYHARQKNTRREVAIKVMHQGPFAGASELARFELEVRVLGQLKHPNIVAILDSGLAGGSFYYVMDHIDGQRLDEYVEAHRGSIEHTLQLFVKICDAVNAAHLRGVIHRDLKPGNILVDATGEPHVLDFGLAKLAPDSTTAGESQRRAMTMTGQFVGSLPWASPEQAEGRPDKIDVRTDVYSLGVILYQMLTGVFPYDTSGSLHHALDHILRTEPTPPSALRDQVDDEVETIVMKCLHKERERRYQTAGELAQDVRRYLAGDPIEAKRDSGWYVLRKTLRRYRGLAILAGLFLFSGFGFGAFMTYQYSRTQMRLDRQEKERAEKLLDDVAQLERIAARRLYATRVALAEHRTIENEVGGLRELLESCPADLRGWEWTRLNWLADRSVETLRGHSDFVFAVAVSGDGRRIVSGGQDNGVRIWASDDSRTFREQARLEGHSRAVLAVAINRDGALIASAGRDRTIRLWDAGAGTAVGELIGHNSHVGALDFSPDGARLASSDEAGQVRIWDIAERRQATLLSAQGGAVRALAFSPDGQRLASGGDDHDVRIWNVASGDLLATLEGRDGRILSVAFSPDGSRLAAGGDGAQVVIWDLQQSRVVHALAGHAGAVRGVRFSPDGTQLLSVGDDTTLRVWDSATGELALTLRGHSEDVLTLAMHPQGAWAVTGSADHSLKLWSTAGSEEVLTLRGHFKAAHAVAFSPDGSRIASAGEDLTVKLWDAATGEEQRTIAAHEWPVRAVAFGADGRRIVFGGEDKTLRVVNATSGEEAQTLRGHASHVRAVGFHAGTRRIVSGGGDGAVRVWDAESGREVAVLKGHEGAVLAVAISRDGRVIASGGADHDVRLWEAGGGATLRVLQGHQAAVNALSFIGAGGGLVSASDDNTLRVWDSNSGREQLTLRGHTGPVRAVACSPDGSRIVSGGADRTLRLWEPVGGEEVISLRGHASPVTALAFAPGGERIVSCDEFGLVKLWGNAEAPPETRAARAAAATARRRVEKLFAELTFSEAVAARLADEPQLTDAERQIAISITRARGDNPRQLNDEAFAIVRSPGHTPAEYAKALRMAELACKLSRNVSSYLNTLGVAQYRTGAFATALQTLETSNVNNDGHPADLAFIALSHFRLGHAAEAQAALASLRERMRRKDVARDELCLDVSREAESVIDAGAADKN